MSKIEVFTIGAIEEQFDRLGIVPEEQVFVKSSYERIGVATLTPANYSKLVTDSCIDTAVWENAGWRNPLGSNLGIPTQKATVNKKTLICWLDDYTTDDEEITNDWFVDLFEYLDVGVGATMFRNASAVMKDLAKHNNLTITELLKQYAREGEIIQ
ncbi:hypothetical protein BCPG3_140 [Bacillus phage BCPG3]|nr:hypothetical protein BCPG1_121 [Bacillus phage BCPG1]QSJ04457.1 hypothetical protein BCPG3_140 [Bacillus phage BCPG3]QSJ04667.1 hypothetical protein BCP18_135 [Bacillus phage BCP18]